LKRDSMITTLIRVLMKYCSKIYKKKTKRLKNISYSFSSISMKDKESKMNFIVRLMSIKGVSWICKD